MDVNEREEKMVDVGNEVTERPEAKSVVVRKEDFEKDKVETDELKEDGRSKQVI